MEIDISLDFAIVVLVPHCSKVYATLLHAIDPAACPASVAAIEDPEQRAAAVLEAARGMDVPVIVQAADVTSGNRKLNLAFVASIFNTRHGLEVKDETEAKEMQARAMKMHNGRSFVVQYVTLPVFTSSMYLVSLLRSSYTSYFVLAGRV